MKKHHYVAMAAVIGTVAAAGFWLSMSRSDAAVADEPKVDLRRFKPTPIELVPPEIPEDMRLADRAAEITAKILIRPDGTVSDVSIVVSHIPAANDLVVGACKKWRFEPAGIDQEMMYHTRVPPRVRPTAPAP